MKQKKIVLLLSLLIYVLVQAHGQYCEEETFILHDDVTDAMHYEERENIAEIVQQLCASSDFALIDCSDDQQCDAMSLCTRHRALLVMLIHQIYPFVLKRSFGSIKQIYAISAELAAIGLGPNFATTPSPQTIKVAPQFSRTAGGIQRVLLGSPEPGATQPSMIEIGTTVATSTGVTTIEIGGGTGQTTVTLGNTNPASTIDVPSNVIISGDIVIPGSFILPTLNLPGNLTVAGDSTVAGMLTVGTLVTSDLMFTNLVLPGDLTVDGTSTLNGNVQAHAGATLDGGGVSINTGATKLSLTSIQDAATAIMLSASSTPTSGITAGVGTTGGFNIVGGPLNAQAGATITGAFTQSGGAVSLDAGTDTITLTSTNALATAIQFNGNTQITGTTDVLGLLTASAGIVIENNGLMVGDTTITGPLSQMNGFFSLQATGDAAINGNNTITIGGTNATSVNFGHVGITTTVIGDLIQAGGALSLTATGTAVIDGTAALGIGNTNATAVTIGNTTASTKLTLEAGSTGLFDIGDSAFPHIIDIGTGGTMAAHIQTINIATSDTPANPINIGGNASSTTITGNLIKTGSGNISFTSNGVGIIDSAPTLNIGDTTINTIFIATGGVAARALNIESGTTASGGSINVGVANTAHAITFGSLAGTVQTIRIASVDDAQANVITFGGVNNMSTTTIGGALMQSGGTYSLQANNAGGTAGIFGSGILNLGTANATAVTVGNNTAATHSVTFESGSGTAATNGINIGSTASPHIINIGTGSPAMGGQTINIGTGTSVNPILIGNAVVGTAVSFNGGLTQSGGNFMLSSTGTGSIDGDGIINIGATATTVNIANRNAPTRSLTIDTAPSGTINIGNSNNAHTINIGAGSTSNAANELLTIGSTTNGSSITLQSGMAAMDGIRYQIGNVLFAGMLRPLSPIGFSLPIGAAPIGVRISTGAFRNTGAVTIAGTGDWTRTLGAITFTNPYTANSICYVAVLDYGLTSPINTAVTPVFKNATLVNVAGTTTLTINGFVNANFYGFIVIGT